MSTDLPIADHTQSRQRRQLPEEVASYVRGLIFSGAVAPGEFLRLEPVAEALGVSNTPVREGLLSLRSEGLVQLVPRRGFMVAPFDQQDVRDLFWVQAQLAGELAARAAKNITKEALAQLEHTTEKHAEAILSGDREAVSRLGHHFHAIVNKAAGSYRLAHPAKSLIAHLAE